MTCLTENTEYYKGIEHDSYFHSSLEKYPRYTKMCNIFVLISVAYRSRPFL
jgi:hypothetical protein